MARNAERTREKLLDAAAEEFAANGIAGARVDRIARAAGVSKPMIYAYLGDKDRLFDAVFEREVLGASGDIAFDADDIPGWAGQRYDHYASHPRLWRLLTWARLERNIDVLLLPAAQEICRRREKLLAEAQARGRIADTLSPAHLVRLLMVIAQAWCATDPPKTPAENSARRAAVQRAVEQLLTVKTPLAKR